MTPALCLLLLAPAMALLVALALAPLRRLLLRAGLIDHPNERSSHAVPMPRGAGLVVLPLAVVVALVADRVDPLPGRFWIVALAALALTAFSALDDRRSLGAGPRLAVHALAVALGLLALPADFSLTQGWLPRPVDLGLALLAWLWFLELTNFMDGTDGLIGVQAGSIVFGLLLLVALGALPFSASPPLLALLGVLLGFLAWNWPPAAIFLGDSGSVPLGYLLGWLLLLAADSGLWAVALILPLYCWSDATLTLLRRLGRGEKVWRAHRQHFYQRAAGSGGHAPVALAVLLANLGLIAPALWSRTEPWWALVAAAASVVLLLGWLARRAAG